MNLKFKYPATKPRPPVAAQPSCCTPCVTPLLQAMNTPSRWRADVTEEELMRALLVHCKHSKVQLDEVLAAIKESA